MPTPHDTALIVLTVGAALAALLTADAADDALRNLPDERRRRRLLLQPESRIPMWLRPMALHWTSCIFLCGMAASGLFLVGAFP